MFAESAYKGVHACVIAMPELLYRRPSIVHTLKRVLFNTNRCHDRRQYNTTDVVSTRIAQNRAVYRGAHESIMHFHFPPFRWAAAVTPWL